MLPAQRVEHEIAKPVGGGAVAKLDGDHSGLPLASSRGLPSASSCLTEGGAIPCLPLGPSINLQPAMISPAGVSTSRYPSTLRAAFA
jgi:hypothetical protein